MRVRKATPRDAREVCAVHEASIAALGVDGYDDEQVAAWGADRSPDDYAFDGPDAFLVAETDGRVVGFAALSPRPGDHLDTAADAEVTGVYVHPDHARTGVGSRLLRALETVARVWDADTLALHASRNAVDFYDDAGFHRVRETTHDFSDDTDGRVVEMQKTLTRQSRASRTVAGRQR
ncbi:GNAT family N-acetyltransferase [Halocalculus aciditolerans]|uniref:N-acetyltransferase domain-containing protein n=1 Tax=Halocalculus aciditolerans TaxID=1383812 RepID=A0A830F956_9EURY|nr:GNAT family N-acetyltransferase [Halocalculus aciditolerans]GGL52127.1 hypothetical protein GCM10009039_08040 [Halocalculus aciditolerans]